MSSIEDIIDKYNQLGTYCENFWHRVLKYSSGDIACHEGCGICCELESVNLLEAFVISTSLKSDYRASECTGDGKCVFLRDDVCTIYASRPIICRTHGLIIKSVEFTTDYSITCPYNFNNSNSEISPESILDIDRVTQNMMKLNYAFCLVNDVKHLAAERIDLADIAHKKLTPVIARIFKHDYE
jgi:uncharacterized protein